MKSPPKKGKGALLHAPIPEAKPQIEGYSFLPPAQQCLERWERHAEWLLTRYRRSGKRGDWEAYVTHVAGMARKIREAA